MKITMTRDYSDRDDHPRTGDILEVVSTEYDGEKFDYYVCKWKDGEIEVFPDECEEVQEAK